jgi:dihydrolipoamide dehydrogenase
MGGAGLVAAGWVMLVEAVDFLVLGGGPGGYTAALHAAHLGRQVTLVDRRGLEGLGGVCLHEGCVPTKALLHLAERADDVTRLAPAGLRAENARVDLHAFQGWKRSLVSRLSGGVAQLLRAAGVDVVAGEARCSGPSEVELRVAGGPPRYLRFTDLVIATGSRPEAPPDLPVDGDHVIDSTGALELVELPAALLVLGGGSVGMELGTTFAKLGTRVTVVEQAEELLPMIDPWLVRPLRRRLADLGVEVITASTCTDFDAGEALVRREGGEVRVKADRVLAGVGRRPNTSSLNLDAAGLEADRGGFLQAGPDRRVAAHIAAIGDVTPGPFHAHRASAEAVVAADALSGRPVPAAPAALPFICHSDPEIASTGLTPSAAREQGLDTRTATFPLAALGWAIALGRPHGSAHLVVDNTSDVILGVHLVGPHATELIGEGTLAVQAGVNVADLAHTIHAHPTLSEQLGEAAHVGVGAPIGVAARRARPGRAGG